MFDFEDESKIREERLEKKFQELYMKYMKVVRLVLLFTFVPIGVIFIIISILDIETFFAVMILGIVFVVSGLIIALCTSKKGNYERYKRNVKKFGGMNSYNIVMQVGLLEERIKMLEEENQELKTQIKANNR